MSRQLALAGVLLFLTVAGSLESCEKVEEAASQAKGVAEMAQRTASDKLADGDPDLWDRACGHVETLHRQAGAQADDLKSNCLEFIRGLSPGRANRQAECLLRQSSVLKLDQCRHL